ncbi:FAS1-like dehydratase domain-containing protein [Nocardioides campestrisoli]|uniref:FAS1-like dehydratase domain-containing protein n=1 Tax=Nocardioides campestrisoli TaxID=2736757 RepID=UPI001CD2F405|nr:MaoC family dehydratase N-terminal domain-containing protein [Nocardioides campestrisoli]
MTESHEPYAGPSYEGWEPTTSVVTEVVAPTPVQALAALLDDGRDVGPGDPLPPLWHWVALPRWAASSVLGADGHPRTGSFLPPVGLPRRMFAGGEVTWHRSPAVGEEVRSESRVVSVTDKTGRSGPLVLVVVESRVLGADGGLCLVERQDILYREAGARSGTAPEPPLGQEPSGPPLRRGPAPEDGWDVVTDPTVLMRFSAATANAHRIHYDWPYATGVEGYPGLVVHGPLMTLLLAESLWQAGELSGPARLQHRNRAPLFCGQPARITHEHHPSGVLSLLSGADGAPRTTLDAHPLEKGTHHA